jgi:hypothetical protein
MVQWKQAPGLWWPKLKTIIFSFKFKVVVQSSRFSSFEYLFISKIFPALVYYNIMSFILDFFFYNSLFKIDFITYCLLKLFALIKIFLVFLLRIIFFF